MAGFFGDHAIRLLYDAMRGHVGRVEYPMPDGDRIIVLSFKGSCVMRALKAVEQIKREENGRHRVRGSPE
jgi:hypothetical protein